MEDVKGLFLNNEKDSLDKATSTRHELRLLASGDGVEIMAQELEKDISFDVFPAEEGLTTMEFFYIIDGTIEYIPQVGDPSYLNSGDYFYTKKLEKACIFKTVTNVKMLYVSTQPIFHYLGESLKELHKLNLEINKKDEYTHGHSERVKDYSLKIALEMGLDRETIASIALAALFHDVGKIGVPDDILNKQTPLTEEEYNIIRKHPITSASFVKDVKYSNITSIVEQHHERLDGSGYPNGLVGDEISLEARIIAVADMFDAMTTNRPYRNAINIKDTLDEIKSLSGRQLDAQVVETLIKVLKKEKLI